MPLPSIGIVIRSAPSRRMVTVEPGSAVPLSVGVVSLVLSPELSAPRRSGTSSSTCVMTGAAGATLSTVRVQVLETGPGLPAASVATAVRAWGPSPIGEEGVKLHTPRPLATVVPISTPSTRRLIVAFASAVPLSVGVASLVVPFTSIAPVCPGISFTTCKITGAPGAVPSTLIVHVFDIPLGLPAGSVAFAVSTQVPSVSGVGGVKLHWPEEGTTTVPRASLPL